MYLNSIPPQARGRDVSRGNGWIFTSIDSPQAYLHTEHAMSWVEAEDFCQIIYGHLATGCNPQAKSEMAAIFTKIFFILIF